MSRPNPIERLPEQGPDRERRANVLRNPDVSPEEQKQVADALDAIAKSESVDLVVQALGLKTNLNAGPVHDFLVNNGPKRVVELLETAFTKAAANLDPEDVQGKLELTDLKQTQASVRRILTEPTGGNIELSGDQRRAAA